ncbi:MAG: Vitamin B12 dependent methionine synthase activation subunit [Clostridia bacterium]|nr:Vitamin B12 dependent methionine synthase activation subunit [Clostridia bacterium]
MIYERICADELTLSDFELSARLKMPVGTLPENFEECKSALFAAAAPAFTAERARVRFLSDARAELCGRVLESRALAKALAGCDEALFLSATLGFGAERLLRRYAASSPSLHFVTDAIADALVEALCDAAEARVLSAEEHTARFSPGYADLPLSFVKDILEKTNAEKLLGVGLTDSYLAIPTKTVTAVIGIKTVPKGNEK